MNILWSYIPEIDSVDPGAVFYIVRHSRRCDYIINRNLRMRIKRSLGIRLSLSASTIIRFSDFLYHFKKSGTSTGAVGFQSWRHCQADGLLCPGRISHDKACVKWIKSTLDTLHRSIKALQVDSYILS